MPNQRKGKATPKSTPSKATTPRASPKTRGVTKASPKKVESPKVTTSPVARTRESRSSSSTPSKVTESPKTQPRKVTPTKPSPRAVGRPASAKTSPKAKSTPKSKGTPTRKVASPKARQVESESESEDENTEFKVGDLIDAEWEDGLFYSARVAKVNKTKSGNTYNVVFTQDNVPRNNLKRNQIQSYSDDSTEPEAPRKHRSTNDDFEYVDEDQDVPLRNEDVSVESDSTEAPRRKRAGRKPATKRKREPVQVPSEAKKRRLTESISGLTKQQLVTLVESVCHSNATILATVQREVPEPKPARQTTKQVAVPEKKAAPKNTAKTSPKRGAKTASPKANTTGPARRSSSRNRA